VNKSVRDKFNLFILHLTLNQRSMSNWSSDMPISALDTKRRLVKTALPAPVQASIGSVGVSLFATALLLEHDRCL
jgi:hypothetical protein